MGQKQYAYQSVAEILRDWDVETVFTLMSDATIGLISTLDSDEYGGIDVIDTRHESGAVAMADGYSRATGQVGVCVVGKGPALAHTATSLLTAKKRGSKLLVLVPGRPLSRYHDNPSKRFNQNGFLDITVGGVDSDRDRYGNSDTVVSIRSHDTLLEDLGEVFRRLMVGEGPIAVQIPADILNEQMPTPSTRATSASDEKNNVATTSSLQPPEGAPAEAVELYLDSDATQPPIILAGSGVDSETRDIIYDVAERMNAYLATTMQARGLFSNHPYSMGVVGNFGAVMANSYVSESDYVLAVGCSLNEHTTDKNRLFGGRDDSAKLVNIDIDSKALGRYANIDLGIAGDAAVSVGRIHDELRDLGIDRESEFWTSDVAEEFAQPPDYMQPDHFEDGDACLDPRRVVSSLNESLPDDRLILHDTGHHALWVLDGIDISDVGDFIWTLDFSAVGEGVKLAIGAATASGSRTCVLFCGDAGFMMSLQEVETAARHDIPILVVVLNDAALGAEYHSIRTVGGDPDSSNIATPNIGEVAQTLGASGHTVSEAADLHSVRASIEDGVDGPMVIDCRINKDVKNPRLP